MIYLVIGNTGARKTTYSNKLKNVPSEGLESFLERIENTETLILD